MKRKRRRKRKETIYGYWQYDDVIPIYCSVSGEIKENDILYVISKKGDIVHALHNGKRTSLDITHIEKACSRPRRGHAPIRCNKKTFEKGLDGKCEKCRVFMKKRKCVNGSR